jgi:hypothetical protein
MFCCCPLAARVLAYSALKTIASKGDEERVLTNPHQQIDLRRYLLGIRSSDNKKSILLLGSFPQSLLSASSRGRRAINIHQLGG